MPSDRANARQILRGVFFVHGLLFASWAAHIPHVKTHLRLSDATLGLVLLATPVGSVSAMAVGAWLLPRVGSRRLVTACLAGYAAAGPFIGIAGSPAALFAALLVWGAFQGTLDVAMNTQAVTQQRVSERPLMSGMHGWWSIGAFTGAGIGALAVWLGVSLTAQLTLLGAATLAVVPLTRRLVGADAAADEPHARLPVRRWPPAIIWLGAIAFAAMLCEGAAADWSAVYLRDSLAAPAAVASLGYAVFALAMVIVRLRGDRLLARHAPGRLLAVLASAAAVGFGVALLSGNAVVALVGLGLLGGGLAAVIPTVFGAAGSLAGVPSGAGIAAVSACGWAGFVCGPPLIGQLASATSLPAALVLVPILTAFVAVAAVTHQAVLAVPRRASMAAHS